MKASWRAVAIITAVVSIVAVGCSGSDSSSSGTSTGGSAPSGTDCPTGSGSGVTDTEVKVAVTIIDLAGSGLSNDTVGVPSAEVQKEQWTAVADSINSAGGAGCRQMVLQFQTVNPIDPAAAQQACLDLASKEPFIAVDSGSLTGVGAADCIPGQEIPLISTALTQDQLEKYSPYYLLNGGLQNDVTRNGYLGLDQLGWFSSEKGFTKLGIIYRDCNPSIYAAARDALAEAGLKDDQISAYSLGCPTGGADTSAAMQSAVLQFKDAGVSSVTEVAVSDWGLFTQVAAEQNFTPQYLFADDAAASASNSGQNTPAEGQLDGAVNVVSSGYGEQDTPGFQPTEGTAKCNAIFSAIGQPDVYEQQNGYGGVACSFLWTVAAMLDNAPELTRGAMADALSAAGSVQLSYPNGPVDFSAAPTGSGHGVGFWRALNYVASCQCWQVPDPTFNPPFP